jgi:hypothetical protein
MRAKLVITAPSYAQRRADCQPHLELLRRGIDQVRLDRGADLVAVTA